MNREELEKRIRNETLKRRGRAVALHSIRTLFHVVADPIGTLGDLFFGAKEAADDEKHRVEQETILDLLCQLDDNIAEAVKKARVALPKSSVIVVGEISAHGENAESVTGVSVSGDSGPVEFKPGTRISARGRNVRSVTGLKIGNTKTKEG